LTKWKKAISVGMSAAMLASLLTAAFAGVASANTSPQALDSATCVPSGCTQVAASGFITIGSTTDDFATATAAGGGRKLVVSGAGATFINATGAFSLQSGTLVDATGFYLAGEVRVETSGGAMVPATDTVVVTGASAGTATITEYVFTGTGTTPNNNWVPDGNTWTLTFTAAADFQVSAVTSTVKTYSDAACTIASSAGNTSTAGTTVGYLGVTTKNAGGTTIANVSVSGSIQPFGTISGAQTYSGTTNASGLLCLPIISAGLSGTSTITATATYLGVSTALSSTTFTFAGPVATLTASPDLALGGSADLGTVKVKGKDANGNTAVLTGVLAVKSGGLTVDSTDASDGAVVVNCTSDTAQSKETVSFKVGSVVSNTVTVWCSGSGWTVDSLVIKAATAAIPAGGSTTFTATLLDENSYPAPDGNVVTGLVSAGLAIGDGSTATYNQASTAAGAAKFTYYAQNTTGPVTLTGVALGVSGAGVITVGPSTPTSSNANKLGLPSSTSSYSTATKVQSLGKYVTWRASVGAANSGKSVGVWIATKNSAGVWSAFTRVTGRTAAADGSVVYYARKSAASWISVRFSLDGVAFSNAVQARWR
jgi:hypothetical protein